jgi:Cu(I)/Ag(I) efflux system membrane fusion protein
VEWAAPHDGFVTEHNIVQGMQAKTGDVLFRIADISTVWVLADVAERDVGMIAPGRQRRFARAATHLKAAPQSLMPAGNTQ